METESTELSDLQENMDDFLEALSIPPRALANVKKKVEKARQSLFRMGAIPFDQSGVHVIDCMLLRLILTDAGSPFDDEEMDRLLAEAEEPEPPRAARPQGPALLRLRGSPMAAGGGEASRPPPPELRTASASGAPGT